MTWGSVPLPRTRPFLCPRVTRVFGGEATSVSGVGVRRQGEGPSPTTSFSLVSSSRSTCRLCRLFPCLCAVSARLVCGSSGATDARSDGGSNPEGLTGVVRYPPGPKGSDGSGDWGLVVVGVLWVRTPPRETPTLLGRGGLSVGPDVPPPPQTGERDSWCSGPSSFGGGDGVVPVWSPTPEDLPSVPWSRTVVQSDLLCSPPRLSLLLWFLFSVCVSLSGLLPA